MKATPWILLAVAISVIIYLSKCNSKKIVEPSRTVIDSIKKANLDTISFYTKVIHTKDSIISVQDKNIDSISGIANSYKRIGDKKAVTIKDLIAENDDLKELADTLGLLSNCEELKQQVRDGLEFLAIKDQNAFSLDSSYKVQIDSLKKVRADAEIGFTETNQQFFNYQIASDKRYDSLKAQIPNTTPSRISIGPFGGATIIQGKIKPVFGIGIGYDLFPKKKSIIKFIP